MVQNARDVSKADGAVIRFVRLKDEFVFEHDGLPFDCKSIDALILQTSSKVRNDIVKVGQYGTGFLTTHRFGLKFKQEGALKLNEAPDTYYNFCEKENFVIDWSSCDKTTMIIAIERQTEIVDNWGKDGIGLTEVPSRLTRFTYLCENTIEKENVRMAMESSPALTPYVLALNPLIKSITFEDRVKESSIAYTCVARDTVWNNDEVMMERVKIDCNGSLRTPLFVFMLKSKIEIDERINESRVIVILPCTSEKDNWKECPFSDLKSNVPQLFLYLPLLGTEDLGWNYIIHAPEFTCDKDTRDSLLFVGNGQNNDKQAEDNKKLIALAGSIIKSFMNDCLCEIDDRKYLGRINFLPATQERLTPYYKGLQDGWVNYFKQLPLVKKGEDYLTVSEIYVLDKELYTACQESESLLDSLFILLSKDEFELKLPEKDDLIHWSQYINEWSYGDCKFNVITLKDVCEKIVKTLLFPADIEWLHNICLYVKEHPRGDIRLSSIVPNEELRLSNEKLVRPIAFGDDFLHILKTLIPEDMLKFVHPKFIDILDDVEEYGKAQVKDALTNYVNNISPKYREFKERILGSNNYSTFQPFESNRLDVNIYRALLDLYKMLLSEGGSSFTSRIYEFLTEYYDYSPSTTEKLDKEYFDIRNCYSTLIHDSLFGFTLDVLNNKKDEGAEEWVFKMVKEIYGYSDIRSILHCYMVYPNQNGEYKYAEKLKKEDGIPSRLKDIYDKICGKDVRSLLVENRFQNYFVENNSILKGKELAEEIESPFVKSGIWDIANNENKNLFVEIIEKLSSLQEQDIWRGLFAHTNENKARLMMSYITDPKKSESLFQIMTVDDTSKLNTIADLLNNDEFERIIKLGEEALAKEKRQNNDFEYKKNLGKYIEDFLVVQLEKELTGKKLKVDVENEQGGQDIIVKLNGEGIYFIEAKSRWQTDNSIMMSPLQHKTSENIKVAMRCALQI